MNKKIKKFKQLKDFWGIYKMKKNEFFRLLDEKFEEINQIIDKNFNKKA